MTAFSANLPNGLYSNSGFNTSIASSSAAASSGEASSLATATATAAAPVSSAGGQNFAESFNQLDNEVNQASTNQKGSFLNTFLALIMNIINMIKNMFSYSSPKQKNQHNNTPYNNTPKTQNLFNSPDCKKSQANPTNSNINSNNTGDLNTSAAASASAGNSSASAVASAAGSFNSNSVDNNTLASKGISQKEIDLVQGKNLKEVDEQGNPKYMIAKGADGKNHIFELWQNCGTMTDYRIVGTTHGGANKFIVHKPENNRAAAAAAASSSENMPIENEGEGHPHSPLILDTNKDGKVSAAKGTGVDLNRDGRGDGAATGGDKMLAMGDINGNGKVDGSEVFGDKTVDPFTGKAINAKNGFEALKHVAKSAEKTTGIKCIDEKGDVDLQKLKTALEKSGKGSLGMISNNNVTQLESLGDAAKINVSNYTNQQQTGDIQHNQLGTYQTTDGTTHKVDDVWFKLN